MPFRCGKNKETQTREKLEGGFNGGDKNAMR